MTKITITSDGDGMIIISAVFFRCIDNVGVVRSTALTQGEVSLGSRPNRGDKDDTWTGDWFMHDSCDGGLE